MPMVTDTFACNELARGVPVGRGPRMQGAYGGAENPGNVRYAYIQKNGAKRNAAKVALLYAMRPSAAIIVPEARNPGIEPRSTVKPSGRDPCEDANF